MTNIKERLKEYEEDRYCPTGCVEYQLDKLNMYKQYFQVILDTVVLVQCFLSTFKTMKQSKVMQELDKIIKICNAALDGSRW